MKQRYTEITFHRGFLIVDHLQETSDEIFTSPVDSPSFGCVVNDVSHVAMSSEAYTAIVGLSPGFESIGDFDLFETTGGVYALGTIGGLKSVFHLEDMSTSKQFKVPSLSAFQAMENTPPQEAVDYIDEALGRSHEHGLTEASIPTRH